MNWADGTGGGGVARRTREHVLSSLMTGDSSFMSEKPSDDEAVCESL